MVDRIFKQSYAYGLTGMDEILYGRESRGSVNIKWSEYVIWHLNPGIKVSIDGRRETVYPDTIYDKYKDFHFGIGG